MPAFIASVGRLFRLWFHKRNIIIVSQHKVMHVLISGKFQFCLIAAITTSICWASYSTGSFMAARSALKEQSRTLRQVTNARIETGFSPVLPTTTEKTADEPMFTTSALEHDKAATHIAALEHKIIELQNANDAIIQRVHDKTAGHIDDLEAIIKQTGLNLSELEKSAKPKHTARNGSSGKFEGGPYIPDLPGISPRESQLYQDIDTLSALRDIIGTLPLASPIHDAEEQSPFGHRIDPFTGHLAFHSGLDLSANGDTKIYSPAVGTVTFAGWSGGYGNCIDIDHGSGLSTRYGHLSQIMVQEGQTVAKGDVIGVEGSTGRSTGPHLHYEVRYHEQPLNPANFLMAGHHVSQE